MDVRYDPKLQGKFVDSPVQQLIHDRLTAANDHGHAVVICVCPAPNNADAVTLRCEGPSGARLRDTPAYGKYIIECHAYEKYSGTADEAPPRVQAALETVDAFIAEMEGVLAGLS